MIEKAKTNSYSYDFFADILSDDEKSAVEQFVGNKKMFDAVEKVLLEKLMLQGIMPMEGKPYRLRNFVFGLDQTGNMSNEDYGKAVRTTVEALFEVQSAWKTLKELGTKAEKEPTRPNRAR